MSPDDALTDFLLFSLVVISAPVLGLLMTLRVARGRGLSRFLAAGSALAAAATGVLMFVNAMPGHAGRPEYWLLPGAAVLLWLGSALARGHWRRWLDFMVLLAPLIVMGLWFADLG